LDVAAVLADEVCGVIDFEEVAGGAVAVAYPIGFFFLWWCLSGGLWEEGELVHGEADGLTIDDC